MEKGPTDRKSNVISIDEWKAEHNRNKSGNIVTEQDSDPARTEKLLDWTRERVARFKIELDNKQIHLENQITLQENLKNSGTMNIKLDEEIKKIESHIQILKEFISTGESLLKGEENTTGLREYFKRDPGFF